MIGRGQTIYNQSSGIWVPIYKSQGDHGKDLHLMVKLEKTNTYDVDFKTEKTQQYLEDEK